MLVTEAVELVVDVLHLVQVLAAAEGPCALFKTCPTLRRTSLLNGRDATRADVQSETEVRDPGRRAYYITVSRIPP